MATRSMPFWPRPATTSGSLWPGSGLCAPFFGRLSWSGITRAAPLPHPPEHANSLFHRRLAGSKTGLIYKACKPCLQDREDVGWTVSDTELLSASSHPSGHAVCTDITPDVRDEASVF